MACMGYGMPFMGVPGYSGGYAGGYPATTYGGGYPGYAPPAYPVPAAAAGRPARPLATDPVMSDGKAELVMKVKELQRSTPDNKQKWESYCTMKSASKFDPSFHDETFLKGFFTALNTGLLTTMAPDENKLELVQKVKEIQRRSAEHKQLWYDYCASRGNTNFDPNRHEEEFLQGFFDYLQEIPGGNAASDAPPGTPGKIFVGRLDESVTPEALTAHFSQYGAILTVDIKYDPTTGACRGFGFVTFAQPASAKQVLATPESHTINGKWVECRPATAPRSAAAAAVGLGGAAAAAGGWGGGDWGGDWGGGWDDSWGWEAMNQMMMSFMMMKGMKGMKGTQGQKGMGKMGQMMAMMGMGKGMGKTGTMGKTGGFAPGSGKGKSPALNAAAPSEGTGAGAVAHTATIFVGALPKETTTPEMLEEFFSQYGMVQKVELKYDAEGSFRGFAFVVFDSVVAAQGVLDNHANNFVNGKWVDCKPGRGLSGIPLGDTSADARMAPAKKGPPPDGLVLRVRGMPFTSTQPDVLAFFASYDLTGRVVMKQGWDGRPTGEAFVEFTSQAEANRAYNDLNFAVMGSRYVELIGATLEDTFAAFGEGGGGKAGCGGPGAPGAAGYGASAAGRMPRPAPYSVGW